MEWNRSTNYKTGRKRKIFKRFAIVSSAVIVGLLIASMIATADEENNRLEAAAARQAQLTADPLTTGAFYTALNKERITAGAPALSTLPNLVTAAEQNCNDMVTGKYFAFKNPTTGKDVNGFIRDNAGDSYLKSYIGMNFSANSQTHTATDALKEVVSAQGTYLNDPSFNSVGWAVCQSPTEANVKYVVLALANKQEKPVPSQKPAVAPSRTDTLLRYLRSATPTTTLMGATLTRPRQPRATEGKLLNNRADLFAVAATASRSSD